MNDVINIDKKNYEMPPHILYGRWLGMVLDGIKK